LLYCSDPGAGMMTKILFSTEDGGGTFSYVTDLTDEISGYPTGIAFSSEAEGFIGTSYHGQDAYFYQTKDCGGTWQSMELPRYDGKDSLYIEGTAPVFFGENQKQGKLLLQYVTAEKRNTILYTSEDGGETWTPQQELECDGALSYDFFSENDGYLIDETGCLLPLKASAGTTR
uniref:WD40/YVTN/BNR-like repeat-containing protein n=1 Tax=Roseburia sp. TaxID=2049040 RepID=UPI003FEFDA4A